MPPGPMRIPQRIRRPADDGGAFGSLRAGGAGRVRSLLLIAVLAIGALVLAWAVLRDGVADALAQNDPKAALLWRGDHAGALSQLAEDTLNQGDPKAAAGYAKRALDADPLDVRAIRVMGLAAERSGDPRLAATLMADAGARSRRDGPTQIWLFSRYAATGEYDKAFARADALLRDRPELARRFFPVMNDLVARPEAVDPLARRLKLSPPWRDGFMQNFIRVSPDPARPYVLLERMAALGAPATEIETRAMIDRLIQAQLYQQAFVYWVQGLDKAQLETLADLRNGEFLPGGPEGAFGWTVEGAARNFVEFADAPDRDGGTLNIILPGGPAPAGFLRQMLVLTPGTHRLSGEVRAESFSAAGGLVWQVRCADTNRVLGETPALLASTPWTRFDLAFEVPAEGCEAQWLRLKTGGKDRRMSGELWFDRMAISR